MGTDRTGLRPRHPDTTARAPTRTCVGCRRTDSRSALLRVVAGKDASGSSVLIPDPRRRLPGRGAWLHPTGDCLDLAVRRRAFQRALRVSGPLDPAAVVAEVEVTGRNRPHAQTESGFDADEHPMSTQR